MDDSVMVSVGLAVVSAALFFVAFRHFGQAKRRPGAEHRQAPGLASEVALATTEVRSRGRQAPGL